MHLSKKGLIKSVDEKVGAASKDEARESTRRVTTPAATQRARVFGSGPLFHL